MSAAFIGAGVGVALGGAYLAAGMGQAATGADPAGQLAAASALSSELRPSLDPVLDGGAGRVALAALDPDAARVASARPSRARELDCLTQAVYFEARGESARGQAAVATVIMNRVKSPAFPKTVCGVVYQGAARRNGCQFSFACDGRVERVSEDSAWDRARKVAARTLSGAVLRDVGSATHFHTTAVSPDWGSRMLRVAQVGLHVFYRFNPHAPRRPAADPAPVFASASPPAVPEIRLAAALTGAAAASAAEAAPSAQAPDAPALPHVQEPRPVVKPEAAAGPSGGPVVKTDAPALPKPAAATAS